MIKDYSILIGGEAGQGSRKAGLIIGKLFSSLGYRVFIYDDYQSLIRGGHNFSQIRVSEKKILSHRRKIDFLLALDENTIKKHENDLDKKGIIIYNSDKVSLGNKKSIGIAMETIVKEAGGIPIMGNTALIAGFAKIVGIKWETLEKLLKKEFKKFQEINLIIAKTAFDDTKNLIKLKKLNQKSLPILTGNETLCLGAVKAGLDFYMAYPMTPATGILHYLAEHEKDFNIAVAQLENEIAVINAAIGAAFSGARTMVGTSGGGFALMTEGLSLAAQSETPLVIVESQRAAPSTGVPTYTGQGDLLFALTAGHGDILRFVIAPGDADETAFWAGKILNLSWKYQTPSILLIDKEISESTFSFDENILKKIKCEKPLLWDKKGKYLRYKNTKNGISPLAFPGQKEAIVKANSYEHDEFGLTVEDEKSIEKMQNKRLRKFKEMEKEVDKLEAIKVYGKKTAKKAIVCWGSTKGPAKEAAENLGIKMVQPVILEPFPEKQIKKALKGVEKLILVETNAIGQLEKVLNCYGIKINQKILKYNARPFLPEEIEEKIKL
ncbi:pyruvate ferredoxin oxidoreductase [Candidatus Wolfebacteria bacterium CG03_land_8_20_14_0_80_36_15]|uniref:Pyruvate ferredoxin oxidoreductase n=1 Tax=Candidatus Wolfebacteria bacterium CG03_land_8_20_14_0_80_36_15 TaxID=1975067 RepID=A0A2M7B7V6_9BACT|nr:MAG: pyruvate ferredoxin oxidoreductase [Candidatus Wolfebacteria bacterium CG03_land_8_20_14_0_80_36_15]